MENERPTRLSTAILAIAFVVVIAAARLAGARTPNWDIALFAILLGFSVFSDVMSIETESHLKISGNFLAMVLAIVFLGGTPAALIGMISILVGWLRFRESLPRLPRQRADLHRPSRWSSASPSTKSSTRPGSPRPTSPSTCSSSAPSSPASR